MKPIFINSSPNTQLDDFFIALKQLVTPWKWNDQKQVEALEHKIYDLFEGSVGACAFDSARSSFYQILEQWEIGEGDEVIVPAFTCTVIVNPVLWVGAKPVYVDIDPITLNIDIDELEKKITDKTKVILAQHTFGLALDMERILSIAKKHNIKVVEDCAHSLGIKSKERFLGTWGDAAVITFGMTKVASGVRGGMAITQDADLYQALKVRQSALPDFPLGNAFRFIVNPVIWHIVTPVYYFGLGKYTLGKILLGIFHKVGILGITNIVEPCEELGLKPNWIPAKMSGALAVMATNQLSKLQVLNNHRKYLAQIYTSKLKIPYFAESLNLRIGVYVKDRNKTLEYFRLQRIILGDWYKSILHIPEKYYERLLYKKGTCPKAEYAASHLVNLPTFIKVTKDEAEKIADLMQEHMDKEFYTENQSF